MVHVVLTGATGLVGSAVLSQLLSTPSITRVSILSRRPVAAAEGHEKAKVVIHSDFSQYPPNVLEQLSGAQSCIWAQGKSSVGMTEPEYAELTHDWPLAAAKAFSKAADESHPFNFVYVSGEGADPTQSTRTMFGRVKGKAEQALIEVGSSTPLSVYNLRPAGIDGRESASKPERPASWQDNLAAWSFLPLVRLFAPKWHTPVDSLAQVAVRLAIGDGKPVAQGDGVEAGGRTLRNVAIRNLAGL